MKKILFITFFCIIFVWVLGLSKLNANNNPSAPITSEVKVQKSNNKLDPDLIQGLAALESADNNKAVTLCQSVVAKDPNNKPAAICLIRALIMATTYEEAKQALISYKTKFGEDKPFLAQEASYDAMTGDYNAGLAILKQLMQEDPTNDYLLDTKQYILDRTKQ